VIETPEPANRDNPSAVHARPPFFIVGAHRSGTTMLRLMLNKHRSIAIPFESAFIPSFYRKLNEYGDLREAENLARLLHDIGEQEFVRKGKLIADPAAILSDRVSSYAELVDSIFASYAKRAGKIRWGDKTPGYLTEVDVLRSLFPDCRIIHLVRDGRDVALSLSNVSWGSSNLPRVAQDWRWKTILAHKMGRLLGDQYLLVRYEDLVLQTENTLRRICLFLEEPYDASMLDYHRTSTQEMPESSMQWHTTSVKPPDPSKLFLWKQKMTESDQIIFDQLAGDALELFGYENVHRNPTVRSRFKSLYYTIIRRW